jgi:hypothetical protein
LDVAFLPAYALTAFLALAFLALNFFTDSFRADDFFTPPSECRDLLANTR